MARHHDGRAVGGCGGRGSGTLGGGGRRGRWLSEDMVVEGKGAGSGDGKGLAVGGSRFLLGIQCEGLGAKFHDRSTQVQRRMAYWGKEEKVGRAVASVTNQIRAVRYRHASGETAHVAVRRAAAPRTPVGGA